LPVSPCEINNSKIPSLSISATAAPVPSPLGSELIAKSISFSSPFSLILNNLFGSPMLFKKISS